MNDETMTKCERCGWQGLFKAQVLQRAADGCGHDHVCPKCQHDTFLLPLEAKDAVIVLQLEEGEEMAGHFYAGRACLILDAAGNIVKNQTGPLDPPWRIWEMNDLPEHWLARTREEAVYVYLRECQGAKGAVNIKAECADWENGLHEDLEHITPMSEEALDRFKFVEEDWDGKPENLAHWQCECGAMADVTCRWNGSAYEHHHGYPVGHVTMKNIHMRTFRAEMGRQLKEAPKAGFFASAEW